MDHEGKRPTNQPALPLDRSRSFAVIVHDVAPVYRPQLAAILDALAPRVGNKLVGAVVPCWDGLPLGSEKTGVEADFLRMVGTGFGEILQHGYTHRQAAPGLISFCSGGSNELNGLSVAETGRRLRRGRAILLRAFGGTVAGFTPPAWRMGRATMAELSRHGFRYLAGFAALRSADASPIPLATWSWDWGVVAALGRVGEKYGQSLARLRPEALPCVVVHPRDVDRGYLPRIVRVIDGLRARGRGPVTFAELIPPAPVEIMP